VFFFYCFGFFVVLLYPPYIAMLMNVPITRLRISLNSKGSLLDVSRARYTRNTIAHIIGYSIYHFIILSLTFCLFLIFFP